MELDIEEFRKLFAMMATANPGDHLHQLGLRIDEVDVGRVKVSLPWAEHLVGNPDTGVIHGGVLTTMLDTCCGFAAISSLDTLSLCPTMDLRIDYMRAAVPGAVLYAEGEVYKVSSQVLFCRGIAYHDDKTDPVAHCVANFTRMDHAITAEMVAQVKQVLAGVTP